MKRIRYCFPAFVKGVENRRYTMQARCLLSKHHKRVGNPEAIFDLAESRVVQRRDCEAGISDDTTQWARCWIIYEVDVPWWLYIMDWILLPLRWLCARLKTR